MPFKFKKLAIEASIYVIDRGVIKLGLYFAAKRIASIMLISLAVFVPAISNAVP